jgi:hypothetical protein
VGLERILVIGVLVELGVVLLRYMVEDILMEHVADVRGTWWMQKICSEVSVLTSVITWTLNSAFRRFAVGISCLYQVLG